MQLSYAAPEPPGEGWWEAVLAEDASQRLAARGAQKGNGAARSDGPAHRARGGPPADDWELARQCFDADEPLKLQVVGYNRGGLLVGLNSLRGFVPASHLVHCPAHSGAQDRQAYLASRQEEWLLLKVIEIDPGRGRIVLSERAALSGSGRRREVLERLQSGDVVSGNVTNLTPFGAFVDLGGVEGLIHVSEMSWGRVDHPQDMLEDGQQVTVTVLSVDREQGRVALSLRHLQPDPWSTVEERYCVGQIVEGVITNVVDFGAFVCLERGLEGLIHISELAEGNFMHPRNVVREGDTVHALVLSIDGAHRRLALSLRRAATPPAGGSAPGEGEGLALA